MYSQINVSRTRQISRLVWPGSEGQAWPTVGIRHHAEVWLSAHSSRPVACVQARSHSTSDLLFPTIRYPLL